MKYLELFEAWSERTNRIIDYIKSLKVGDVISEDVVYSYVQAIHVNDMDWEDGDLGERIEQYKKYKLEKVSLDDIEIDEFMWDEYDAEEYALKYKETGWYPPIVLSKDYGIIDGTHRANGLDMIGEDYILAFVGK